MPRSDSIWLTLRAGLRDLLLQEHNRCYHFFKYYLYPNVQTPQMITFIGGTTKISAMRHLRFESRAKDIMHGEIHLRGDSGGFRDDSPLIYADCEMHNFKAYQKVETEHPQGDVTTNALSWHRGVSQSLDQATIAHMLYSKLLVPFSNVICLFAEDLGGLNAVAELLALWLVSLSSRPSDLPLSTSPHVVILTQCDDGTLFDEKRAAKDFMIHLVREAERKHGILVETQKNSLKKKELNQLIAAQFGGIQFLNLPHSNSDYRSWKPLRSRILHHCQEIQTRRKNAHVAFSATHFKAFFHLATNHFCSDIVSPFNFVRATRLRNVMPPELSSHITNFLKQVKPAQYLNFAVPVIASSLMYESYPAGMHNFHPSVMFKQLFNQLCLSINPYKPACESDKTSPQFVNAIEVAFAQFAFEVINRKADEVSIHSDVLTRFQVLWKGMYSNVDCFACLANTPENKLTCQHALCDQCTITHGESCEASPRTFWPKACPLCGQANQEIFMLKPDTAGVRVLIAEGGGIRGVVPLSFLEAVEHAVGLPMKIHEYCDIAVGSSSGSLVVLGLCSKMWTVGECIHQFQHLSKLAFRRSWLFTMPLFSSKFFRRLGEIFLSFATDSRYSSNGITEALVSAFGETSSLFGSSGGGTKLVVVATTTEDSTTCIFTNYNGPEKRSENSGYKLIRPDNVGSELPIWQAARASSAAPPYFKSFQGYQDGGLGGHTNPINLALWEQDTIWSRQRKQPDFVISLGTGFRKASDLDEETVPKPSFFRDRCVPRLFRSFLNFFVGETRWRELQNSLQPQFRDRYHRLNIEFCGEEPELDDIQAMPSLRHQTRLHAASNNDVQNCADNILASFFYLELLEFPEFDRSLFICNARILCRISPPHRALRSLANRLQDTQAQFHLDFHHQVPCIDEISHSLIDFGGAFCRNVSFKVASLEDSIDIKIGGLTRRGRSISNCPYKVSTLIEDSGLDFVFGSRKGKKRSRPQSFTSTVVQLPKRARLTQRKTSRSIKW